MGLAKCLRNHKNCQKREGNSEMKEILNHCKKFGEAQKFRSHIGKCLIQDRSQIFFYGVGGFPKILRNCQSGS